MCRYKSKSGIHSLYTHIISKYSVSYLHRESFNSKLTRFLCFFICNSMYINNVCMFTWNYIIYTVLYYVHSVAPNFHLNIYFYMYYIKNVSIFIYYK